MKKVFSFRIAGVADICRRTLPLAILSLVVGTADPAHALGLGATHEVRFQPSSFPHAWRMVGAGVFANNGEPSLGILYDTPFGYCQKTVTSVKLEAGVYEARIGDVRLRANAVPGGQDGWSLKVFHWQRIKGKAMDFDIETVPGSKSDQHLNWAQQGCFVAHIIAS